ncbi:hypothetical protein NEMBOFW57_005826 [Staphylotrichum longicolle]|uniref:Uncharacterized protein n=1 Tax=Staphylotrichum longicolle TaxID=669026 RepID=A0AAD4I0N3_9PEZI|nr:hypothetical protein NEMBOFW57_005826 [Staphylotrichum longicolle]
MAPATISEPLSSSPRAATHLSGPDDDGLASPTPTRPVATTTSPPPTVRADFTRSKVASRDAGHHPGPAPWYPDPDPFHDAGDLRDPADRSCTRNNTGDSTILSNPHSAPWSRDVSDTSSYDDYSLPAAPQPQPQPLPQNSSGAHRFIQPPPWHPPIGPAAGWPPPRIVRSSDAGYSESESGYSEAATRSLAGEEGPHHDLHYRIRSKQRKVRRLKHEMARKRKGLQQLRRKNADLDNAFLQMFRPHLTFKRPVAVIPIDVLRTRLFAMQSIRDQYYTAESAYEAMEMELDAAELDLEMMQMSIPSLPRGWVGAPPHVRTPPPPPPPPPPASPPPPPLPPRSFPKPAEQREQEESRNQHGLAPTPPLILRGISGVLHEDIHPLYEELLEAAGDRQVAKEYVEDLEMRREKILYDLEIELHRKRVREDQGNQISEEELRSVRTSLAKVPTDAAEFECRFGIPIPEDDLDFLRDYEATSQRARGELDEATETLAHLRTLCLKRGVMRKHPSFHEEFAIYSSCPGWSPKPQDGNMTIDPVPPPPPPLHTTTATLTTTTLPRTASAASAASAATAAVPAPSLAHPRFPILLSNPSHVLALDTPVQALKRALKLPKDDPSSALRRAECMKELGIDALMKKFDSKPDYINQWLIHRLRTSPMEAELMLAVCEGVFRVVNLRRWQEEVLYFWRLDEAAKVDPGRFEGASPGPGAGVDAGAAAVGAAPGPSPGQQRPGGFVEREGSVGGGKVNSVIEGEGG